MAAPSDGDRSVRLTSTSRRKKPRRRVALVLELEWPYRRHVDVYLGIQRYTQEVADWECVIDEYPELAGRSPSYLARQINDFKQMTRQGPGAKKMQPVVANLADNDILAVAAYVASLKP